MASRQRLRDEFERDTRIGYQAVRIYVETLNHKRMPKFQSLLGQGGPRNGVPTLSEQRMNVEALSAHIGVPLKRVKLQEQGAR